jgi:putative ABC transport system permease protein
MGQFDFLGLVLKDIQQRKFSSFLTLFAISLGILSLFVIVLVSQGFESSIQKQFEQFGTNRLYVTSTTSSLTSSSVTSGLTDNDVSLILSKPYVKAVYPYYYKSTQLNYGNEFQKIRVIGTTPTKDYFDDINVNIAQGRALQPNEKFSMVVGSFAQTDAFSKELRLGSNIYIGDVKFKVVGILESLGNPEDDNSFYTSISTLRDIDGAGDSIGVLDVVLTSNIDVQLAKQNLQLFLDNRVGEDVLEVISPDQFLDQLTSILDIVNYTLGGIAFVALIVGAFGIINTMYVIVTEKTKDIGIMKSIGATNGKILFLYMFQAGLFGFLGAVLGVSLGTLATLGFEKAAQNAGFGFLEITISLPVLGLLLLFGFLIGVVSGYLPAKKASQLKVVDSLRM